MLQASVRRFRYHKDRQRGFVWLGSALALAAMLGCDEDPVAAPQDVEHNPVAPTANALVSSHQVWGDPSGRSSIYRFLEAGDGTWTAYGAYDGTINLMHLAADGVPLWTNHVESYRILGVTNVTASWLPVGAVSVGTFDSDGDGQTDNSRITAWGSDGSLLDEIVLTGGDLHRWAVDVVVSASVSERIDFIVVGSASRTGEPFIPWVERVSLQSDSTLQRGEEYTFPTLPLRHLTSVMCDPTGAAFYVGGETYEEDESTVSNAFVLRLSGSLQLDWFTDLVATPGLVTNLGGRQALAWTGSNVIAVGRTEIVKEKPPSNGGYWHAALVTSLSTTGTVEWMQSVVLSTSSERFEACWFDGKALYAAGRAAYFFYPQNRRSFGYGLLTELDVTTGSVLTNYTFGDPAYQSGFNTVVVHGERAWCAGFTEQEVLDRFRAWFVDVDFTRPVRSFAHPQDLPLETRPAAARPIASVRPPWLASQPGVAP